jgi:Amt family ammonium transporter
MILIAGFLSFNGGSLGSMTNPGDGAIIARVISNTVLGGSGGGIAMLCATKLGVLGPSFWNFSLTVNSALIGMVNRTWHLVSASCMLNRTWHLVYTS